MYRYLGLVWDPADARAAAAAKLIAAKMQSATTHWASVIDEAGLAAWHADVTPGSSETRLIPGGRGAVFGKLVAPGPLPAEGTVRHLLEHCWGRYVAIVRDATSAGVQVLRDPSGALPCLRTTWRGVHILFSDAEDCLALEVVRFTINWHFISAFVPFSALQVPDTGLNEVIEVQAGECVTFRREGPETVLAWDPILIAQRDRIEDAADAAAALREAVRRCVQTWAAGYDAILHSLSGGLDSSIVLSCLRDVPNAPRLTCLNYFAHGRDEDERKYARLAARHANVELVECELDSDRVKLEDLLSIRRTAKPWFYIYELEHRHLEAQLAAEKGATVMFSGGGGDALFFQSRADLAVTDYLFAHGIRPRLLSVALDAARVTRTSIWPLLRKAFRTRLRPPRTSSIADMRHHPRTLINPDVIAAARGDASLVHPWLKATAGALPGVAWHVASMSVPPAFYDSFGLPGAPERVFPLISQPLTELCLRIPTYVAISGGRDRAIARRAFARDVPQEIIRRRAKGSTDQHSRNILEANVQFVRELLLDGLLVQQQVLNRKRLEEYLARIGTSGDIEHDVEYNEILQQHICTEAWLRRWHELENRAAA